MKVKNTEKKRKNIDSEPTGSKFLDSQLDNGPTIFPKIWIYKNLNRDSTLLNNSYLNKIQWRSTIQQN
jgi:hypothetical protein